MKVNLECQYCGFKWQDNVYSQNPSFKCSRCKDSNIKALSADSDKVDYYAGCPPFKDETPSTQIYTTLADYDSYSD